MCPVHDVDVVQRLHMVAGEADGNLEDRLVAFLRDLVQRRLHLGLDPRLGRARALALPGNAPFPYVQPLQRRV